MSASSKGARTSANCRANQGKGERARPGQGRGVVLRSKLGKVHVNLGPAHRARRMLSRRNPDWRSASRKDLELRPEWISAAIADLAVRINVEINAAAAVTPINLVAMAILATPRQALAEARPRTPGRALSIAVARCAVRTAGHGHRRQRRANDSLRRNDGRAREAGARARRHHAHERRERGAGHLLSQQHPASVRHAVADRLLFREQRQHAHGRHPPLVWRVYPYIAAELFLRWTRRR